MTIPADNKNANIAGAAPSANTFTEILRRVDLANDGVQDRRRRSGAGFIP